MNLNIRTATELQHCWNAVNSQALTYAYEWSHMYASSLTWWPDNSVVFIIEIVVNIVLVPLKVWLDCLYFLSYNAAILSCAKLMMSSIIYLLRAQYVSVPYPYSLPTQPTDSKYFRDCKPSETERPVPTDAE